MKRFFFACLAAVAAILAQGHFAAAAAIPAEVDLTAIRAIQLANLDGKPEDQVYALVTGVAAGQEINERIPKEGTMAAAPKTQPIKTPQTLWKGDLDDGQFVLLTVTLMQGDGSDADKVKDFLAKLTAADQQTPGWNGKTLAAADVPKFATSLIKNQQPVIVKIKDIFSRSPHTDHYGGQFNLLVWNNGGKLAKRLDPIGLTFGEHFGTDVKIYTKLKATRSNVLMQDENGQWSEEQLLPLDDDETTIRVKMLETEVPPGGDKNGVKHVTDYLAEIQVKDASGKPAHWTLEGENTGYDVVHTYYDYAD